MKRIIALVLSLCILLTSFVALCSCDIFVNDPSSGVEDSIGGDDQGNDPILDNDENDDVDDSDTDTDNDNNNDNNDSGNDGDCSSKHTDENNDDVSSGKTPHFRGSKVLYMSFTKRATKNLHYVI